jgi:CRP-like cAMP-binding protein
MKSAWLEVLAGCDLFRGIATGDIASAVGCFRPSVLRRPKGGTLVPAGGRLPGVGVVAEGSIEISKQTFAGERVIMNILGPGGLFAEIAVFGAGGVSPAAVTAREDCAVLFFAPEDLTGGCSNACAYHRAITANLIAVLSRKAAALNRKIDYLVLGSLRAKICSYLLEERSASGRDAFRLDLGRAELADWLHVARPSLSREMGRLRDEGVIDFRSREVRILDAKRLKMGAL